MKASVPCPELLPGPAPRWAPISWALEQFLPLPYSQMGFSNLCS